MNVQQVMSGEFLRALYYKFDNKTGEYGDEIKFKYKTYDDTQYREARNQQQAGNLTSKFSISIKTSSDLPFKVKDKVKLLKDGRQYEITGVQQLQDTSTSLVNIAFPERKGNNPTLIHLNKDDV